MINPSHLRQAAAYFCDQNNGAMVAMRKDGRTVMVCMFENEKFKFFYEEESL